MSSCKLFHLFFLLYRMALHVLSTLTNLRPLLPSMRKVCLINRHGLWDGKSVSHLKYSFRNNVGRNHLGQLILYTRCHARRKWIRTLNHYRKEYGIPGTIIRIEYDPRRSSFISLVHLKTGLSFYTTHTDGQIVGNVVTAHMNYRSRVKLLVGDRGPISAMSHGTVVHSLESFIGSGAVYFRSAGTYGIVLKRYVHLCKSLVKFKTGLLRLLSFYLEATIGIVSNKDLRYTRLGKAGRNIWLGIKPQVRGVAMNPIDHPHGGGNGKKSKPVDPKSAWGRVFKWRSTARIFRTKLYVNETRI